MKTKIILLVVSSLALLIVASYEPQSMSSQSNANSISTMAPVTY